eukprot:5673776-Pyramimonas_sp.AAC.1
MQYRCQCTAKVVQHFVDVRSDLPSGGGAEGAQTSNVARSSRLLMVQPEPRSPEQNISTARKSPKFYGAPKGDAPGRGFTRRALGGDARSTLRQSFGSFFWVFELLFGTWSSSIG